MTLEEQRFTFILVQTLRKSNVISDAVAGNTVKRIEKVGDADASPVH